MANHQNGIKMEAEVLLINPPPLLRRDRHDVVSYPHLGLGYISAYLRQHGFDCQPIDAKFERIDLEKLVQGFKKYHPRIVGITAMTHEIGQAAKVAQLAKEFFPGVMTVLGGPHATALPKETLEQFSEFDVLVVGEGEMTMRELVKGDSLPTINGIAYRDGLEIKITASRELIKNLDELPLPAWDLFPSGRAYPLIITRGCPFHCNFCMRVSGNIIRKRNPESVIEEFKSDVNHYGAVTFYIQDESFAIDKKQANAVLDALIEGKLSKKISLILTTRVDLVNEEFLRKLKTAGCQAIAFGVESGNEEILKATGKNITLKKVEESIALAKKAGLRTSSLFIIGHPYETRQTALDTINFAAKLNTSTVAFGIMVPYPGTEIYEMALRGEGGYKIISSDWADFNKTLGSSLELETLSRKDMEKLQLLGYSLFYLKNWRFLGFFGLLWQERRVVWAILRKIFKPSSK